MYQNRKKLLTYVIAASLILNLVFGCYIVNLTQEKNEYIGEATRQYLSMLFNANQELEIILPIINELENTEKSLLYTFYHLKEANSLGINSDYIRQELTIPSSVREFVNFASHNDMILVLRNYYQNGSLSNEDINLLTNIHLHLDSFLVSLKENPDFWSKEIDELKFANIQKMIDESYEQSIFNNR
ncbi:hypothetical protein DS745_23165 [Anaerobacillus alkaliphilus]|uniref:Uncharacterized protein n=1 Tax=Anaerobacillus alkaliphilus TaxID=1548597 RepID=A0A4Q0VN88_9BACI|nr:hypothetical protein [Anaerobacillus alkaliphilus]RXI96603.1 hypothetical protein DS745_23165 [Anaerobacillus alkaliphilus]